MGMCRGHRRGRSVLTTLILIKPSGNVVRSTLTIILGMVITVRVTLSIVLLYAWKDLSNYCVSAKATQKERI